MCISRSAASISLQGQTNPVEGILQTCVTWVDAPVVTCISKQVLKSVLRHSTIDNLGSWQHTSTRSASNEEDKTTRLNNENKQKPLDHDQKADSLGVLVAPQEWWHGIASRTNTMRETTCSAPKKTTILQMSGLLSGVCCFSPPLLLDFGGCLRSRRRALRTAVSRSITLASSESKIDDKSSRDVVAEKAEAMEAEEEEEEEEEEAANSAMRWRCCFALAAMSMPTPPEVCPVPLLLPPVASPTRGRERPLLPSAAAAEDDILW